METFIFLLGFEEDPMEIIPPSLNTYKGHFNQKYLNLQPVKTPATLDVENITAYYFVFFIMHSFCSLTGINNMPLPIHDQLSLKSKSILHVSWWAVGHQDILFP